MKFIVYIDYKKFVFYDAGAALKFAVTARECAMEEDYDIVVKIVIEKGEE